MAERWWVIEEEEMRRGMRAVEGGLTIDEAMSLLEEWVDESEDYTDEGGSELYISGAP